MSAQPGTRRIVDMHRIHFGFVAAMLLAVMLLTGIITNVTIAEDKTAEQIAQAKVQDRFFKAIESGDCEVLLSILDPGLREKMDKPVVDAWIKELNRILGKYKGLEVTNELEGVVADFYGGSSIEFERVGHARGPLTIHMRVGDVEERSLDDLLAGARSAAG